MSLIGELRWRRRAVAWRSLSYVTEASPEVHRLGGVTQVGCSGDLTPDWMTGGIVDVEMRGGPDGTLEESDEERRRESLRIALTESRMRRVVQSSGGVQG